VMLTCATGSDWMYPGCDHPSVTAAASHGPLRAEGIHHVGNIVYKPSDSHSSTGDAAIAGCVDQRWVADGRAIIGLHEQNDLTKTWPHLTRCGGIRTGAYSGSEYQFSFEKIIDLIRGDTLQRQGETREGGQPPPSAWPRHPGIWKPCWKSLACLPTLGVKAAP